MLKVWGRRSAFNVQKVMWLIGELNISHEHIPVGGILGELDTPEFLSMNPHGRIPVISDNETVVWESHTILRYLAANYGEGRFWSEDPKVRSKAECWMDWAQTTLQPDFLNGIFRGFYRTPESERNWTAIQESLTRCNKHFLLLEKILESQAFLCGSTLTLADIPAGSILYRYFELEIERPALPSVEAWYGRLRKLHAYQEHVMIPFSDMYGRLDY